MINFLCVSSYFLMEVSEVSFLPTFNFLFDTCELFNGVEHVGSFEVGAPMFCNDSINLLILAPEVLESEGECFVSGQIEVSSDDDRHVVCTGEAAMLFNNIRKHA